MVTCALIAFLFPRQVGVNGVDIALRLQCVRDELLTGAMLFSAVFLLNEPYTCAHHRLGRILYGVLMGAITMASGITACMRRVSALPCSRSTAFPAGWTAPRAACIS